MTWVLLVILYIFLEIDFPYYFANAKIARTPNIMYLVKYI